MTNTARGEVSLRIGARTHILCLTLGALAELERHFGAADLSALGARLKTMTRDDLQVLLAALGGEPVAPDAVNWNEAAAACATCFRLAFAS